MNDLNMEAERAAFMSGYRVRHNIPDFVPDNTIWAGQLSQDEFNGWLAARRAAPAVGEDGLPPLPAPDADLLGDGAYPVWNERQVRQAQREAVAARKRKHAALQEMVDIAQECDMGYGADDRRVREGTVMIYGTPDDKLPLESTLKMDRAGRDALRACGNDQATDRDAALCWSAMIDKVSTKGDACGS